MIINESSVVADFRFCFDRKLRHINFHIISESVTEGERSPSKKQFLPQWQEF